MPNPQLSILVVDDTKFSSAVIGHTLSQAGYNDIRFASSAMDALSMHEERPASVMVADWLMPEMDGLEFVKQLRAIPTEKAPAVVFCTSKGKAAPKGKAKPVEEEPKKKGGFFGLF